MVKSLNCFFFSVERREKLSLGSLAAGKLKSIELSPVRSAPPRPGHISDVYELRLASDQVELG